jgi:hypothetical protein
VLGAVKPTVLRTLTASPVERMAAALLAGVDDVPSWRNHEGEKNWLFNNTESLSPIITYDRSHLKAKHCRSKHLQL